MSHELNVDSALKQGIPKFNSESVKESLRFFSEHGYVIYKDLFCPTDIEKVRLFILSQMEKLRCLADEKGLKRDDVAFVNIVMNKLLAKSYYKRLESQESLIDVLKQYLGPDICKFDGDQIWFNEPKTKNRVLVKNVHTDVWTGTSINTLFCWVLFTDVEFSNSLGVCPGSHALGLMPVKNRQIWDIEGNADLSYLSLDNLEVGDLVMWHPLLLHFSVGTGTTTRAAISMRYTSTQTPFSSQELAIGYRSIVNGPMSYVMRVVGSDYALPFRVLGGPATVDRMLSRRYPSAPVGSVDRISGDYDCSKLLEEEGE